jgi:hypothetical protein
MQLYTCLSVLERCTFSVVCGLMVPISTALHAET